ncbi:MAG: MMPL family transporter [Actinomycetota bacterium]|nr:MMPL family transporter [Actinomycetota bacterium]
MPHQDDIPKDRSVLGRLAGSSFRHRRSVLVGWLVIFALSIAAMMTLGGEYGVDYATPGSESKAASGTIASEYAGRSDESVEVVYSADGPVTDAKVAGPMDEMLAKAGQLEGLTGGVTTKDAEISPDGRTAIVSVPLDRLPDMVPVTTGETLFSMAQDITNAQQTVAIGGAEVGQVVEGGASSELIGIGVAALVLLATFGGALAAGLPLVTALFGVGASVMLGGVLAAVLDTPDWAAQVAIMIGLGVGIDYALLILTRYRSLLADGLSPAEATESAMRTAGRSVVIAGATVVISMLGLFLMGFPYLYGVALASSLAVLLVLAANLTLLPALLGFAGHGVNRLRVPGLGRPVADPDRSRAARWARGVQRRPKLAAVVSVALLLAMTAPLTGIRFGFPDAGNEPATATTRVAYDMVSEGFGPGANGPLIAVVDTPDAAAQDRLASLSQELKQVAGVKAVGEPQPSESGTTNLVAITPTTSPQDDETKVLIDRLRDGPLAASGLNVDLGGATAATVDQGTATASRLPLFIGGVIGLSFLLLLVAFRAPVIALKAGVLNLLSIGAAYGVVSLVAEGGWAGQLVGIDTDLPVPPFIPVMMFAVLFGLSMDYEVFLMSRIKEELAKGGDARMAVVAGVARTAKVITAAALIMIAVFGAFALSPAVFLKLIGIGLATAILIDATIVRMILVPAIMELLGEKAWWAPSWLKRLVPEVDLEGTAPRPAVA